MKKKYIFIVMGIIILTIIIFVYIIYNNIIKNRLEESINYNIGGGENLIKSSNIEEKYGEQ